MGQAGLGWVTSFQGHTLAFTGRVLVDGDWTIREDCVRMAAVRGAADWKPDMSRKVSLLVHGDLASQRVTDQTRQYSKKLKLAAELRAAGHKLAVIDGQGFSDLVSGYPARNRELLVSKPDEVFVLPQPGEGILGGPLEYRKLPSHRPTALDVDLEALDRGTAAHEATLSAFAQALSARGILPEGPGRHSPQFDVGWVEGGIVFVAEVKSLGGAVEDQQIRLGLGQVLDYAHQLRGAAAGQKVQSVVVLERSPADPDRWLGAMRSAEVLAAWGPEFEFHR